MARTHTDSPAPGSPVAPAGRREQVLAAARKIFLARGLAGTRTRQIAEEAGASETVIWSNFSSKEELFAAAVFDPLERMMADTLQRVQIAGEAQDAAKHRLFVEETEAALEVMKEAVPLLGVALSSNLELSQRYFDERLVPLLERWASAVEMSLEGWEHRAVDYRTVMMTAWGMHFGLVFDAFMNEKELDGPATTKQMVDLLYYGLVNKPKPARSR